MKQINQKDYREMLKLGWIDFSISSRNIAITNKNKKSRCRTYYVEDELADNLKKLNQEQK